MVKLEEAFQLTVLGVSGTVGPRCSPAPPQSLAPATFPVTLLQLYWPLSLVFAAPVGSAYIFGESSAQMSPHQEHFPWLPSWKYP